MDVSTIDLKSVVTIKFLSTGSEIMIHKDVLCGHCEFAEVCLRGSFKDSGHGKILLKEEEDEDSLRTLVRWMYLGKAVFPEIPKGNTTNCKEALQALTLNMTKLYIMTDKYLMSSFKTDILLFFTDLCHQTTQSSFYLSSLNLLLTRGPSKCELKQLLVDRLMRHVRYQYSRGEKSFFIEHAHAQWTKDFFALMGEQPELASFVLRGFLQPDVSIKPKVRESQRERDHDKQQTQQTQQRQRQEENRDPRISNGGNKRRRTT